MKLQTKVPLLLVLVLLLMGIVSAAILLYSQRSHAFDQFRETAQTVDGVIQDSLEQAMLAGDRANVQQALESITQNQFIHKATVLLPSGVIAASSEVGEIGNNVSASEVPDRLLNGDSHMGFETIAGQSVFQAVTPVINKAQCQTCHDPQQKVLGAIELSLDTTMLSTHLKEETLLIAVMGAVTFVLVGGGLGVMLRKTVLNRLSALAGTAQRLSQGDYAARSTINAADEVGVLASTFNDMAANVEERNRELEDSRRQMAILNAELEERVKRRTEELSAMNTVLSTLSQPLDASQMLKEALSQVMRLMDLESGAIYSMDKSGRLVTVAEFGSSLKRIPRLSELSLETTARQVAQSRRPVLFGDGGINAEQGGPHAFACFPLGSKTTLGMLVLASSSPGKFDPEKVRLLTAICDAIGIAMEKAAAARAIENINQVREQLLKKLISAQEEERRRIARDLHDEASQSLAAVAINLEDVANSLPPRYKEARQRLATLKERMVSTLSDIRGLALELRPSALDDLGLPAAIDWYAKDYLRKRGLEVSIESAGPRVKLPSHTETMLFRIMQEALTNIVSHAQATKVSINLGFVDSTVVLRVEDNGAGFDVQAAMTKESMRQHLGIYGMTERATLLGGTLAIRSQPGHGTVLLVEVPLEKRDE